MDHRKGAQKGREKGTFRALDGFNGIRLSALERMAGTTRLELATSAVTGGDIKYSQQLTRLLGTAKYLIIPISRPHFGLNIGLKNAPAYIRIY